MDFRALFVVLVIVFGLIFFVRSDQEREARSCLARGDQWVELSHQHFECVAKTDSDELAEVEE